MVSYLVEGSFFRLGISTMPMSVVEAGRLGGRKLFQDRGREFFVTIGRRGQKAMRERYPGMANTWGKKGGRPKKPKLE